ncbi:MAG: divergent polysaccharide deacetylase family protein [Thermodesulfobacteriota bacterium]
MVKKKAGPAKRPNKSKSSRRNIFKNNLKKTIAGIAILLVVVVAGGYLLNYLLGGRRPASPPAPPVKTPPPLKPVAVKPAFEVFPQKDIPVRKPLAKPKPKAARERPRVAIIIDDLGYDSKMAQKFIELDAVLTFSILPFGPFQRQIADSVHAKGFETMLHLPMEPVEYPQVDPGEGALLASMTPDELIEQLNKNLEEVPHAKGVNNHMGSRMTANSTQLYQIFTILKKRDLFFIDSRTTADTLCKPSARLFQLSFSQRDIFLDNIQQAKAVRKQLNQLLEIAESHGEAIGIAHPYAVTVDVLREMLPEIQKKVELVPASALVHVAG